MLLAALGGGPAQAQTIDALRPVRDGFLAPQDSPLRRTVVSGLSDAAPTVGVDTPISASSPPRQTGGPLPGRPAASGAADTGYDSLNRTRKKPRYYPAQPRPKPPPGPGTRPSGELTGQLRPTLPPSASANKPPIPDFDTIPVMYQGASDDFLGPQADVPFVTEADGIDFEGEFGVIVDDVPMAVSPEQAAQRIRLLVQINDWSLRAVGAREVRTGFGFLQAKPSTSFAPMAVTPDEVGDAWRDGRLDMALHVHRNGERIGAASGREMAFSFPQLIAHAARTRRLTAGTIIGSGTVSNADRAAGSSCLAEVRAIEMIERGEARTPFLRFGDEVTMQACFADGRGGPFGRIAQRVVRAAGTDRPE
ncbi:fumarylacetoacetate hydrolase family protein [Bradyrhizobium sp.]|uniref:fumarylacetoacetate hydrolase family protein n=1 Tax=Bradyrhizobium sp. TaxID=376 RepID=UPI002915FD03|nr:fumarylacetoacetate hydrolase family protein [Bradyrhizobium sp.]